MLVRRSLRASSSCLASEERSFRRSFSASYQKEAPRLNRIHVRSIPRHELLNKSVSKLTQETRMQKTARTLRRLGRAVEHVGVGLSWNGAELQRAEATRSQHEMIDGAAVHFELELFVLQLRGNIGQGARGWIWIDLGVEDHAARAFLCSGEHAERSISTVRA